ncbi:MAG: DUF1097 domain-containing protein [Thermincolia bacterium]
MNPLIALAVAAGVLAVPWVYLFVMVFSLPVWVSFIASGSYFAAGGQVEGLKKAGATVILGVIYGAITAAIWLSIGGPNAATPAMIWLLSAVVGVVVFIAVVESKIDALSFVPGIFFGFGSYFGVFLGKVDMANILPSSIDTLLSVVIGIVFAYIIQFVAGMLTKKDS